MYDSTMIPDADCLFCKIAAREIPATIVYEDSDFLAFLDIRPINLGHTLVIPKVHCRNIFDYPASTLERLGPVLQKLAVAVRDGMHADGINVSMNNEPAAGQIIFHAHVHVTPRYQNDEHRPGYSRADATPDDLAEAATKITHALT